MIYHIYILRTESGTLYTGITTDLERRIRQHATRKGSKYLKSRRPVALAAGWTVSFERDLQAKGKEKEESASVPCRSVASKLEHWIKAMDRAEKLELIASPSRIKRFDLPPGFRCKSLHAAKRRALQRAFLPS